MRNLLGCQKIWRVPRVSLQTAWSKSCSSSSFHHRHLWETFTKTQKGFGYLLPTQCLNPLHANGDPSLDKELWRMWSWIYDTGNSQQKQNPSTEFIVHLWILSKRPTARTCLEVSLSTSTKVKIGKNSRIDWQVPICLLSFDLVIFIKCYRIWVFLKYQSTRCRKSTSFHPTEKTKSVCFFTSAMRCGTCCTKDLKAKCTLRTTLYFCFFTI